jgi:hypothetical protein
LLIGFFGTHQVLLSLITELARICAVNSPLSHAESIDGQPSMRYTDPDGQVYTHSTVRAPEDGALVGSMTMTSTASTSDLLQPSTRTLPTMNLRTASHFNDNELVVMIISALGSGVRTVREVADLNRVTEGSLRNWLVRNGGPSWGQLKKLYPRTAPKEKKKRKAVPKTGEQQTKKKQ